MIKVEREFKNQFKSINARIEDILSHTSLENLEKRYMEIGEEFYSQSSDILEKILNITRQIKTIEDLEKGTLLEEFDYYLDEHDRMYERIKDKLESKELMNETFDIASRDIIKEIKEMHLLALKAKKLRMHKLAVQLDGMKKSVYAKICTFINLAKTEGLNEPFNWIREDSRVIQEEFERVKQLCIIANELEEDNDDLETSNKVSTLKMLDLRDIDKFLYDNGFESVRQSGSHKIYHKDGHSIPVPQHSKGLGKGLSIKIQKQVVTNS